VIVAKMIDRLTVIASGNNVENLLGIPKIPIATGVMMVRW
jgi:hypothetical protein